MWTWFHRLASPPSFYVFAGRLAPWLLGAALVLLAVGAYGGLVLAPPDYQQGDAFRIIYVHVPAAWMSLFAYTVMAVAAFIALVWRLKLAEVAVVAAAPVGASFTALALVSGMLWGKPMWGAWWVWDARLTSELVLLFLYLGVVALNTAIEEPRAAARACSLLAVVGFVNVPIVHYSVVWWNSLHQGSTVFRLGGPTITWNMLWPMLVCMLGFTLFFGYTQLVRMRSELLMRERTTRWVKTLVANA
ncbi:MAG: heme ABC transporter permease [Nevskiaceae bacterium]|nr:MAG: heme ABC transporter permease [Nevskiaceae bacterium]TBR73910.1 MAG: heme ABC transporter permease [Nevskiaceae bacterium]